MGNLIENIHEFIKNIESREEVMDLLPFGGRGWKGKTGYFLLRLLNFTSVETFTSSPSNLNENDSHGDISKLL